MLMGLFDSIHCHAKCPGAELLGKGEFQTKDLGRRMDLFTITEVGRLIHHRKYRAQFQPIRQHFEEVDVMVPLHRDITFCGQTFDGKPDWLVARFTDGRLEWIRLRESLSEDHREYLWAGN
jgi:hypothetical protein